MDDYYNSKEFIKKCKNDAKKEILLIKNKKKNINIEQYKFIINNNSFKSKF